MKLSRARNIVPTQLNLSSPLLISPGNTDPEPKKGSRNTKLQIIPSPQFIFLNFAASTNAHHTSTHKKLQSLIISDQRPNTYKHILDILNEIVTKNNNHDLLKDVIEEKGDFHIDIIDSTETNAFIEFESNNIYITSTLIKKLGEKYGENANDALAFFISHEIGHKLEEQLRSQLKQNILNSDNTWLEDFADQSACQLLHNAGFDLEPILDIFTTLFEAQKGEVKTIPFVMSHPHDADRDLFIRQCYEQIYSRQSGEYTSPLSNNKFKETVQNEVHLKNKYDFVIENLEDFEFKSEGSDYIIHSYKSLNKLNIEDCNTIEKGLLKALSILEDFRKKASWQAGYDIESEREGYQNQINLCLEKVRQENGASDFTIDLLKDIIEYKVNLVGKSQINDIELSDKYKKLSPKEVIHNLTIFLQEIPSSIELDLQNYNTIGAIGATINEAFIDITSTIDKIDNSLLIETLELMDLVQRHGYYFTWFKFEDKNTLINEIEKLIKSDKLELARFIVNNVKEIGTDEYGQITILRDPFSRNESDLIFRLMCDPVAQMSNQELLNSVLDKASKFSEWGEHIHQDRFFDEYFNRLMSQDSPLEIHEEFLNHFNEIHDVIKDNKVSKIHDQKGHPGRFLKSLAQQFIKSSIKLGHEMNLDLIQKASKISGSIDIPDELVISLKSFDDINRQSELVLRRQSEEYVPEHHSGNALLYATNDYKRDNQFIFRRRVKELLKGVASINLLDDKRVSRGWASSYLEDTPGLGDGGSFLANVNIKELGYQSPPKIEPSLEEFKDNLLLVMNSSSLLEKPDIFKAILLTADAEQQIVLIELLKTELDINEKTLNEYSSLLHKDLRIDIKLSDKETKPSLLESVGLSYDENNINLSSIKWHSISPREYLYLQYFNQEFDNFKNKSIQEMLIWFKENWSEKSSYRDVILNKLFSDNTNNVFTKLDKATQTQIIDLYESDFKSIRLKEIYLDHHLSSCDSLDAKINLIVEILTEPSKERDERLGKAFLESGFDLKDYEKYSDLFLVSSIEAFKKDRVAMHGAGALFNIFFGHKKNDKDGLKDARETAVWLIKKGIEVPSKVKNYFNYINADPQLMKDFFNDYESLRKSIVQEAFVGDNGFFSHPEDLNKLLDSLFGKSLEQSEGKNKEVKDRNKLKTVVREALYRVFDSHNETKKLEIMNRMVSKLSENPDMEFEDLVHVLLSAYGTVGVKLAQILASQNEIKERFPVLYTKLDELKDANAPIPISEVMDAIKTNPNFYNKDVKVLKLLGSASIKCVYLAEIDGEEAVLKVRRKRADKSLTQEIKDFEYLVDALNPLLKQEFGISNIPNYSERIFTDIKEEVDLIIEAGNMREMANIVNDFNSAKYSPVTFSVSRINQELSNGIIMVESLSPGVPLKKLREDDNAELVYLVEQEVARFTAFCADRFIHVDPHDGNIFVNHNNDGKVTVSLIDLGLAQKLPKMPKELNTLITDNEFWDIVNSLNVKDFTLLSQISKYTDLESLLDGGKVAWNILNNIWKSPMNNKLEAAFKFHINPLQISKTLDKFAKLKEKLVETGYDQNLRSLLKLIGTEASKDIIQKSQNKSLKEMSLVLLNQLDKSKSFKVNQELWRFLLSVSKNPYIIERIKEKPDLLIFEPIQSS